MPLTQGLFAARKRPWPMAPKIRACAEEIDANRELPRPLFEALADAGLFHMALPRALGCAEIDLPTYIRVIEELGKGRCQHGLGDQPGRHFCHLRSPHAARYRALDLDRYAAQRGLQHAGAYRSGGGGAGRIPG